jgi:hypothetical protein
MPVSFQNLRFTTLILFFLSVLVFTAACTRSSDANNSVVSVAIPGARNATSKIETFQAEIPQHIVVKITGAGMSPVNYIWDGHGSTTAPVISLTVPQGPARLIQVLYVSQDATQTLYFYYNDVTQDFTSANVSVAMTVNSLSSSATQGQIIGRYLELNGAGPTGVLSTIFQPPGGKPVMVVDRNEMFGGWFKAFALPSQAFSYVFEDSRVFLKDFILPTSVTGTATALINQPFAYRKFSGGSSVDPMNAQIIFAGFFGPGSAPGFATRQICVNPNTNVTLPNLYSDNTATTGLNFYGSSCVAGQACLTSGGLSTSPSWTGVCSSGIDNLNYMKFSEGQLANKDSVLLFRGPFALTATSNGAAEMNGSLTGTRMNLSWSFITGGASGIDGVEIFYKYDSSTSGEPVYKSNNGYDCNNLKSQYGFSSAGQFSISQTSLANYNVGTGDQGQYLTAIACPYSRSRSPMYFSSGARWINYSYSPTIPALSYLYYYGTNVTYGNCQPVMVALEDAGHRAAPALSLTPITVTSDSIYVKFFRADDCSDPDLGNLSATVLFTQGETAKNLYFIASSPASAANIFTNTYGAIAGSPSMGITNGSGSPSTAAANFFGQRGASFIHVGACQPNLIFSFNTGTGNSLYPANSQTMAVTAPNNAQLYSEPTCVIPIASNATLNGRATIVYSQASVTGSGLFYGGTIGSLSFGGGNSITVVP